MLIFRNKMKRGFSLVEVLWGIFLLATAIVVIVGIIIAALQGLKKSDGLIDATNVLIGEKCKIFELGYNNVSDDTYVVNDYYVIYHVDGHDFPAPSSVTDELQVVSLGVYNVEPNIANLTPPDRLVRVITTINLLYKP